MSFGDLPIRQLQVVWPHGEYASGRIKLSSGFIHSLQIQVATVYCPARGPTFPNARALSESLLTPVSSELVCGRSGCRMIVGDFNCEPGALDQMKLWKAHGWCELQEWFSETHGVAPRATCKQATCPDQIWLSPEMLRLIGNVGTWRIFPDHDVLIAGLVVPAPTPWSLRWPHPGHIPWTDVSSEDWDQVRLNTQLAPVDFSVAAGGSQDDSTSQFHRWSAEFEQCVSSCMRNKVASANGSFFGRGALTRPKRQPAQAPVVKHSRPGEVVQASSLLNRAVNRWFRQLRRLQSYRHAVKSSNAAENFVSRAQLWHSIRTALGFRNGFESWWTCRPVQLQGSPGSFPRFPPNEAVADLLYEDFLQNYRRFEHYQAQRRRASCESKALETMKNIFAPTKKQAKPTLDCLIDTVSQPISVVPGHADVVSVPTPFPSEDVIGWKLHGHSVQVTKHPLGYQIESDVLHVNGQELECQVLIHDTSDIDDRLRAQWVPRWTKHKDVSPSEWTAVVGFAEQYLPHGRVSLPPLAPSDWRRAINTFKPTAATGPCGWSIADLKHMNDAQVHQVVTFFQAIEEGHAWPTQFSTGLIYCSQKKEDAFTAAGYRPLTITSLFYRVWAGIRSGQILSQIAGWADKLQCGFLPGKQAADVWYFVGVCLEVSCSYDTPVHGLVADLVKAYNTLPRVPCFAFLRILGVPSWFLDVWQRHLAAFCRYFVVRHEVGLPIYSQTGFPEGCPLACSAMAALDVVWHVWQKVAVARVMPLSYVDNLELIADSIHDLSASYQALTEFCAVLDLQLDFDSLFAWSSCPSGRRELKNLGFNISLDHRDLGGQVTYCRQLRNRQLTARIQDIFPSCVRLAGTKLPEAARKANIKQVVLPRALHGCEAVIIGQDHYNKLRSHIMKAMKWDKAGASPWVRIALLNIDIDPLWYDIWHVFTMFRRQCASNPVVADWWGMYMQARNGPETYGPFGKLLAFVNMLELQIDADFTLWITDNSYVNVLYAPADMLQRVLQERYRHYVSDKIRSRPGFDGLYGFDWETTLTHDPNMTCEDRCLTQVVRDGTFFTHFHQSKFDNTKSLDCQWCCVPDTRAHRYETCSFYDELRGTFADVFEDWDSWPDCFKYHGLIPANPWQNLLWEALAATSSRWDEFEHAPSPGTIHCFTDGSCSEPDSPSTSLAAWSVVWAGRGTVSCGHLPGLLQCILRAEIMAVLSALKWTEFHCGELHLWVDNATVVDHMRDLMHQTAQPADFAHEDLWRQIHKLLQTTSTSVNIHKVASHTTEEDSTSPLQDFVRIWNDHADYQASVTNAARPRYLINIRTKYKQHRMYWRRKLQRLQAFHLAVAQKDIADAQRSSDVQDIDFSTFEVERTPNTQQLSAQFDNVEAFHFTGQDRTFQDLAYRLRDWLCSQDATAPTQRAVSFLEIFVAFRIFDLVGHPVSAFGTSNDDRYGVITFAADFSYFKKIAHVIFRQCDFSRAMIDLSIVQIHIPLIGIICGWNDDVEKRVFSELSKFVGRRPVHSSQALAKPWRVCPIADS
eukprot:Skav235342  [mRNA]  locus=scaffold520:958024:962610:- [translate_table: standard]